nr:unnamed protein product [Digitaria exilis]
MITGARIEITVSYRIPSTCTDWANISDGPAGLIAEFTLASDVADYVRFRAVCRSWRRCSPDPRASGLDSRFLPRRWIMLDNAHASSRRHRFLNVSTGECIQTDLPELAGHTLLALTPEGLLLLLHEPTLVARLLNPLTCQLIDLPPVTGLLSPEHHRARHCGIELGKLLLVYGTGLVADGSKVAVSFCNPRVLAVAKPGDESWTPVDDTDTHMYSALPFAGRFYCVSYRGVMVLNFSSDQQQPPQLLMVAERSKLSYFSVMADSLHLVDNGRELLLVHRMYCEYDQDHEDDDVESDGALTYVRSYVVYKVDLDAGILIPANGLNERAVFMGMSRSISVSASDAFPYVAPNTIYLGVDCDGETREYNVADGNMEPWHYCPLGPHAAVDCLRFCIKGHGAELLT